MRLDRKKPWSFGWGPLAVVVGLVATAFSGRAAGQGAARLDDPEHSAWPTVEHAAGVGAVLVSASGDLFVGTSEGLVRFDGHRMVSLPIPGAGAGGVTVKTLFETRGGLVLAGTVRHGLLRVQGARVEALGEKDGVPAVHVRGFAQSADGAVWVATREGIARFPLGAASGDRPLLANTGLPHVCVHALAVDAGGVLWAGTHVGLARWADGSWHGERGPVDGPVAVDVLWPDRDGTLWIGTRQKGLWRRNADGVKAYGPEQGLGSNEITAVRRDRRGRLLVATKRGHLAFLKGERFEALRVPGALCADQIEALAEDGDGALWIGTERCGLHRLAERPFVRLTRRHGLPVDSVVGLNLDVQGNAWIGTGEGGVLRAPGADPDRLALVPCAAGRACEECWDFSPRARADDFYTVCTPRVLLRWDGRALARAPALPVDLPEVERVVETSDGALWVVQREAVRRIWRGVSARVPAQEGLRGRRVIHEGRGGTIWIAATDGVVAWRPEGTSRTSGAAGASNESVVRLPSVETPSEVTNLHEDAAGALWFGTRGAGLRRLARGRIATIGVAHGLPSATVVQVLEDDRGRLWASGRSGVFAINKRALEEVADGVRSHVDASVYDANDGFLMQTNVVGRPAGLKDPFGRLWFATESGLVIFDPSRLRAAAPRVVIEQLRLGRELVPLGAGGSDPVPSVGPGPGDLEARIAAKSFAAPETLVFRYRLEGRDDDWVDAGSTRSIRYAQLAPGRYRLSVTARSRDGDWGDQATAVAFVLRPPFHHTIWFALSCAAVLGLALAGVHRVRLVRTRAGLQAAIAERARIAREIHDTLAQAFVATSVQLECVDHALEEGNQQTARKHLATARTVVEESLDEARRSVWVLRPQALERGLVAALDELVRRLAGGTVIELEVVGAPRSLPASVEANLLRIAQESLANALRHASARRIVVHLDYRPRALTLEVTDDGTGVPGGGGRSGGNGSGGAGIAGMRERAQQISGVLSLHDAPGGGTVVRVEVST